VDVGADRIEISSGGFVQANALLREALAEAVLEAAARGERALELFAGAGFFSLGLARRFGRLVAVESDPRAADDLRRNLRAAGLGDADVIGQPVEEALRTPALRGLRPDAVVLDPPRTGLAPGAARDLASLGADRIVYVSCDPATLARDLGLLADAGYALRSVALFDLFPQTAHVEALARLGRT
jgi:23S rRNA (uracil1939-C5)-methyltransferase